MGKTDTFDGNPIPCTCGLHASPTPWDALRHAAGLVLWEVEIPDDAIPHGNPIDKYAGKSRTYKRQVNIEPILRQFTARRALSVIDLWEAPDIVREYLRDEAKGEDRSDIRGAAQAAAWAAAQDAAWDAAWNAAWGAAQDAARDAARAAAWNAAWDAAWDTAKNEFNQLAIDALDKASELEVAG